jgi:hypothetical protein
VRGVQVERERGDERLALARGHLGDAPLMQRHATDELYVVRHHVPDEVVTRHRHGRPHQPPARLAHGGIRLGQQVVEHLCDGLPVLLVELLNPVLDRVALGRICALVLGLLCLVELGPQRARALGDDAAEVRGLPAQLLLGEVLELLLFPVDGVEQRLEALHLALVPRAEDRLDELLDHSPFLYSPCAATYSATPSGTQ